MATPRVHLEADHLDGDFIVIVVCECGARVMLDARPTLDAVINTVAEHNYTAHLRPDNTGLRIRR